MYLFLERGKWREKRGRETSMWKRNIDWLPLIMLGAGTEPSSNPGTCPDQELNRQPFALWNNTQSAEPHWSGLDFCLWYHQFFPPPGLLYFLSSLLSHLLSFSAPELVSFLYFQSFWWRYSLTFIVSIFELVELLFWVFLNWVFFRTAILNTLSYKSKASPSLSLFPGEFSFCFWIPLWPWLFTVLDGVCLCLSICREAIFFPRPWHFTRAGGLVEVFHSPGGGAETQAFIFSYLHSWGFWHLCGVALLGCEKCPVSPEEGTWWPRSWRHHPRGLEGVASELPGLCISGAVFL